MTARRWELAHPMRPLPENELRKLHWRKRAEYVAAWRETYGWLPREQRIPRLDAALVTVVTTCRTGTTLPDVGAVFNTAKAAIDGLVDAHVLPDDDPEHLLFLGFVAPQHGSSDRFVLILEESA